MNINTITSLNSHPKSILSTLQNMEGLPFRDVLSSETIGESFQKVNYRERYDFYPPDVTLWAFLSQVLDVDHSLEAAVTRVIAFSLASGKEEVPSSNTAAYSKARSRMPEESVATLARASAEQMEKEVISVWLWKDTYHIKLVDGSTLSMPDTPENQLVYPQPDSQKEGVGFPIARIVTVTSGATGAVLDLAIGPYSGKETGENALLRQILSAFNEGDVALGDCYYASFFLIAQLMQRGVHCMFPIHASRDCDFRQGKRLGKKDHIVEWFKPKKPEWMEQEIYHAMPNTLSIREMAIQSNKKGFRSKPLVIVTTFLDSTTISKEDIAALYFCRWWVELDLRAIKETMSMDILRGKTPEMVRKEIWVHLLAYNLIRKIMAQAAFAHNKKPRELSFKLALHVIKSFRDAGILSENNPTTYRALLKAIAQKKVGNRPGRSEPRMVKRRPKSFPRLPKARQYYQKAA